MAIHRVFTCDACRHSETMNGDNPLLQTPNGWTVVSVRTHRAYSPDASTDEQREEREGAIVSTFLSRLVGISRTFKLDNEPTQAEIDAATAGVAQAWNDAQRAQRAAALADDPACRAEGGLFCPHCTRGLGVHIKRSPPDVPVTLYEPIALTPDPRHIIG